MCYYKKMEDDQTVSVSKGVFVFKNNFKPPPRHSKHKKFINKQENIFSNNLWYSSYSKLWKEIEDDIQELNKGMFSSLYDGLVNFVKNSHDTTVNEIPTAALLTGINMPDHESQFAVLTKQMKQIVSPHVACLYGQDCQNIKYLMEHMMNQFINDEEYMCSDVEDMDSEGNKPCVKKNQLSLPVLQCWYENLYQEHSSSSMSPKKQKTKSKKKVLVVIIPHFESINIETLQKFILITSCYIKTLPFVFIFGIATSIATLHTSLPYQVASKISIRVFNLQPSTVYLNNILEEVFFTHPFHLGGKVFSLFTDIFLFYDLSVSNFIQNIKFAMAEHFSFGNVMALCTSSKGEIKLILNNFTHDDCENARHILSFRTLVESETFQNRIKLLTDDEYFKKTLEEKVIKLKKYIARLHIFLKCLLILVEDLPRAPLGKQIRQLYLIAVSKKLTSSPEYQECFQLLEFQSKDDLAIKLTKVVDLITNNINDKPNKQNNVRDLRDILQSYLDKMNNFDMIEMEDALNEIKEEDSVISGQMDRQQLKEKLFSMAKQNKPMNRFEKLRKEIVTFLSKTFEEHLVEPKTFYFHEVFFFDNISIQNNIIGTHRSAIHNALTDPQFYLQCTCCEITESSSIRPLMPDICIAYKLHLECGKIINLYDWLQAFLSIVDPREFEDDSKMIVDPDLQARFTQAVTELEFLGFIKSSNRKADHVSRLTWGG